MAKQSKNLQKVQDMLDGTYNNKIQSGYSPTEQIHKVGDVWTDSDGKKWEQKNGYRVNLTKLASAGVAEQCSDCEKYISKPWDKEIFKFNNRCYYCQIDFEAVLKSKGYHDENGNYITEFDKWKEAQEKRIKEDYIKAFEKENEELVKEIEKLENPFDTKVANAMANANVSMEIKKNKS